MVATKSNGRRFDPPPATKVDANAVRALERKEDRGKGCNLIRSITKGLNYKGRGSFTVKPVVKDAMSSLALNTGGNLIPEDYSLALFDSIAEHSFVEPRALVVPMTSRETRCPMVDPDSQGAAGVSPFFGGLQFVWGQEAASLTQDEPIFKQVTLTARDLIGQLVVSNQFLDDIGDAGELALMRLFGQAVAWYKEYAYFRGTGAANQQPIGMVNANCAVTVTRSGGGLIAQADVLAMAERMLPSGWPNAIWAINPKAIEQVMKITNFQANESTDVTMPVQSIGRILTRPVFATEKLPTLGTTGDIVFFDPSLYVIGAREDVLVEASPHVLFQTNQTVFRVWYRGDGKCLMSKPATMADNSANTVSQVVLLS